MPSVLIWNTQKKENSRHKSLHHSLVAYELVTSAVILCPSSCQRPSINWIWTPAADQLHAEGKHQEEDVVGTPQVHKSDIAAYLPASAVIAADAKQKHEAARDLQSHHSSSSEWFICDEPEICTRCFVIHVTIQVIQYYILIVPR